MKFRSRHTCLNLYLISSVSTAIRFLQGKCKIVRHLVLDSTVPKTQVDVICNSISFQAQVYIFQIATKMLLKSKSAKCCLYLAAFGKKEAALMGFKTDWLRVQFGLAVVYSRAMISICYHFFLVCITFKPLEGKECFTQSWYYCILIQWGLWYHPEPQTPQ